MSHLHLIARRPASLSHANARQDASADIIRGRAIESDERWAALAETLAQLRLAKRCSVRIVDADCAAGELLIHAAQHAHELGFTAIEGRGIDGAPSLVARARSRAAKLHDRAIGLSFEVADVQTALAEEAEFPADIVLWNGDADAGMAAAVAAAGHVVIGVAR